MSWDTMMPFLLRNVIGDTTDTPTYTDENLQNLILSAAQFVQYSVALRATYTIDPENGILLPDPTLAITKDDAFINLVTLKSAAMLLAAEVRKYGQQAIAIRDGTSAIDLKRNLGDLNNLARSFQAEYQKAVTDYYHFAAPPGEAIVGPHKYCYYTNPNVYERYIRW